MTQAGSAIPAIASGADPDGGPALRVAIVSDGRPTEAGPARPMVEVFDGRPVQGNNPLPIVIARGVQASQPLAGPPIPVSVVSGYLGSPYTAEVLALSPIGFWPLDELSGATAFDRSGNAHNGTYNNVALGVTGPGDGRPAASFNGLTSFVNLQSAGLAAAFNGAAGTIELWAKVSAPGVWVDGITRYMAIFFVNASNLVYVRKNPANNSMQFVYVAGGTVEAVIATYSGAGWTHFAFTWDKAAEQMKAYTNGVQTGSTQVALGVWAGAPTVSLIGAQTTAPTTVWSGSEARVALYNRALTAVEIASLASLN